MPGLIQELEPNKRGVAVYQKGKFLGYEDVTTVSDEELAEEAEQKAMATAEELINSISNLADAKVFLKRLCKRLFKNGALP